MFRRSLWVLPLLLCACQFSFNSGGRPNRPTAEAAAVAPSKAAALDRGLAAIRASHLEADIAFLASDELEGRDTPSRGLRIAAEYLRARARQLGWEPGAGPSYFYSYDLTRKTLWSARSFGSAQKEDMRIVFQEGTDYVFRARPLVDHEVTGEVVFAGGGSEEELEGLELEGRWVLCRDDEGVNWWRRRAAARAAGAAGVLIMPGPVEEGGDAPQPFGERLADMLADREGLVLEGKSEPGFPHVFLEQHAAQRLLEFAGIPAPAVGRPLGVEFTEKRTFDGSGKVSVPNVCAFWPGTDDDLAREVIVVSAHYDHVGMSAEGEIYNGADDNASGSAALLALAEALRDAGGLRRSVLLMWVSGEEKGLLGSAAWTRAPLLPEGCEVVCNLNVDMIARNAPDQVLMTPSRRHPEHNQLSRFVEANASLEGFEDLGSADAYWNRSDHANFSEHLAVPVVFLFTDVHEDYHQPSDTVEKLDYDKAERVTRLALRVLFDIDADD